MPQLFGTSPVFPVSDVRAAVAYLLRPTGLYVRPVRSRCPLSQESRGSWGEQARFEGRLRMVKCAAHAPTPAAIGQIGSREDGRDRSGLRHRTPGL
jgi:hypothetical protein